MKLTHHTAKAMLAKPCNSRVGRENPFSCTGEKTPLQSVVFLCLPFGTGLIRAFKFMTGLFVGQSFRLVAPVRGILTPIKNPAAICREKHSGDIPNLAQESRMTNPTNDAPHAQTHELLAIDYSHRTPDCASLTSLGLCDTVIVFITRAKSSLNLVKAHFMNIHEAYYQIDDVLELLDMVSEQITDAMQATKAYHQNIQNIRHEVRKSMTNSFNLNDDEMKLVDNFRKLDSYQKFEEYRLVYVLCGKTLEKLLFEIGQIAANDATLEVVK